MPPDCAKIAALWDRYKSDPSCEQYRRASETPARFAAARVAEGYCPGLSTMTIAEPLRSKNKALKVEELPDLLGVAIRTVYKEVEDNQIPFFRVRSSIRFDPHQVADWLEAKNGRII